MITNKLSPIQVSRGDDRHIKQVAALLTNLTAIAEKEIGHARGGFEAKQDTTKMKQILLDSNIPTPSSSIDSAHGPRLKKIKQRARAISIEAKTADLSYYSPANKRPTMQTPLYIKSACVTPIPSPSLGERSKRSIDFDIDDDDDSLIFLGGNIHHQPSVPKIIHLTPKMKSDLGIERETARSIGFVSPIQESLSDDFDMTNQVPKKLLSEFTASDDTSPTRPKILKLRLPAKTSRKSKKSKVTTSTRQPPVDGQTMLIRKRFCWRDFPELENILISSRREYLSFSSRNYTPEQKRFNNNLTAKIIKTAEDSGYKFDPQQFNFSAVRDRIRCFYKSYVQGEKKRLFAALAETTSADEIQRIKAEIAFLGSRSSGPKVVRR